MLVSIGILAYNEAPRIGSVIRDIGNQDLLSNADILIDIHVVANGCADATAAVAREAFAKGPFNRPNIKFLVHEVPIAGKSNAWNELIHNFASPATEFMFLLDADVRVPEPTCLLRILQSLATSKTAVIAVDTSMKDLALKPPRSLVDRLILAASGTSHDTRKAVAGGLYCARFEVLRSIWMPIGLPGEDGFLGAMIVTSSFTAPEQLDRLVFVEDAYHVFESERGIRGVFRHNLRLVIGTGINVLLFHRIRSLVEAKIDVAAYIRERNGQNSKWLNTLVEDEIANGKYFLLNREIVLKRFRWLFSLSRRQQLRKAPAVCVGAIFDLALFFTANYLMRRGVGAGFW